MRRREFLAATSAAALAPVAARAQALPGQQQFLQQLTIAVSVPLSGPLQDYGRQVVQGAQAAVDEANRYTAISHVFGLRALDDQNSGTVATSNIAIAKADTSVVAMIGNLTLDVTLQALPQYANANFALVIPTVTSDTLTSRGYHNIFRLPTKDSSEGRLFAQSVLYGRRNLVARAIVLDGSTYGQDVAYGFVKQAKSDHHDADVIVLSKSPVDPANGAKTILEHAPTYVYFCGKPSDLGPVADAMRVAGYKGDFGASDAFYTQETIDKYHETLDGSFVATALPPLAHVPSQVAVLTDFQREVQNISAFSAFGYAAAQLLIQASQRANATTRFSMLNTLQQGGTYNLLVGQYSFNFAGDAILPDVYLYTISKDGFTYKEPAFHTGYVV